MAGNLPHPSSTPSAVRIAHTPAGYWVRVEGRGTMRESPAVHEFAIQSLDSGHGTLTIDLSACEYLDSTFLGSLLDLHRRFSTGPITRLTLLAAPGHAKRLFGPTRLDRVLRITDPASQSPEAAAEWLTLPAAPDAGDPAALSRHVMECHRRLAEIEGPAQAAFSRIAEQMARDLEGQHPVR